MRFQSIVNFVPDIAQGGFKILAPATGQVDKIEAVPGANHAFKFVGEGVLIRLEGQTICSPINGKIIEYLPSLGKVLIQAKNKMRFLLQLSFQHLELNGLGIKPLIRQGQTVEIGQPILQLDLYKIKLQLKPVVVYFLLIDHQQFKSIEVASRYVEAARDPIFSLIPLTPPEAAPTSTKEK